MTVNFSSTQKKKVILSLKLFAVSFKILAHLLSVMQLPNVEVWSLEKEDQETTEDGGPLHALRWLFRWWVNIYLKWFLAAI
jgi:hypothetical protein